MFVAIEHLWFILDSWLPQTNEHFTNAASCNGVATSAYILSIFLATYIQIFTMQNFVKKVKIDLTVFMFAPFAWQTSKFILLVFIFYNISYMH